MYNVYSDELVFMVYVYEDVRYRIIISSVFVGEVVS